jgi:hypothetical protein
MKTGTGVVFALCVVWASAAPAAESAPPFDLAADLTLTRSWARQGAYVPVRLRVTNRTDVAFDRVLVDSGGAVRVAAPWRIAPGETAEKTVPVYFPGGDLVLAVSFASPGGKVGPVRAGPDVRPLDKDTRLFAFVTDLPGRATPPSPEDRLVIPLDARDLAAVARCGVLDGVLFEGAAPPTVPSPRPLQVLRLGEDGEERILQAAFPPGAGEPVQPAVHDLLPSDLWPAADRRWLWLALGLATLAVLALGLLVPRRRPILAAGAMVALAAAAAAAILLFGGVRESRVLEARIVATDAAGGASAERFVRLESRGRAMVRLDLRPDDPLPIPILQSSSDLFRPSVALDLGETPHVFSRRGAPVLGFFERVEGEAAADLLAGGDLVAALLVAAAAARPPDADTLAGLGVPLVVPREAAGQGGPMPVGLAGRRGGPVLAWAAQWCAGSDRDLAHAGRALAWWSAERRAGPGPRLLLWCREPPAADGIERLPTMLVLDVPTALARASAPAAP